VPDPDRPGYGLGILLIGVLVALALAMLYVGLPSGPIQHGPGMVLLGLYSHALGVMFLAAYRYRHHTFFLRGLVWICEHSNPSGRIMALGCFAMLFALGTIAIVMGLS
jgi:hypothetical protein